MRLPAKNQGLNLYAVDHFQVNDDGRVQAARAFWGESCCIEVQEGMGLFAPNLGEIHR